MELKGRSGGPSAGHKAPASPNVHQYRPSAARLTDASTRGKSMPSRELVRIYSNRAAAHGLSLGSFPVDRKNLTPPKPGKCAANGVHEDSGESQKPQENPFAGLRKETC